MLETRCKFHVNFNLVLFYHINFFAHGWRIIVMMMMKLGGKYGNLHLHHRILDILLLEGPVICYVSPSSFGSGLAINWIPTC